MENVEDITELRVAPEEQFVHEGLIPAIIDKLNLKLSHT